jgi:hypothetical protein
MDDKMKELEQQLQAMANAAAEAFYEAAAAVYDGAATELKPTSEEEKGSE